MTMRRPIQQTLVFAAACVATAVVWNSIRRNFTEWTVSGNGMGPAAPLWTSDQSRIRMEELAGAETPRTKLKAALRLNEIPTHAIREALEGMPLVQGNDLTLPAKLLLVRWAADDGESAMNWAWKRFRSEGVWERAFREIISSWAWHHPAELCAWAKRTAETHMSGELEISLADAEASDLPLLDPRGLDRIALCLVRVAPREAFEVIQTRGFASSELLDSLQSVASVSEALVACGGQDGWETERWSDPSFDNPFSNAKGGPGVIALTLLRHWRALDPEDFKRSRFAHLIPDMDRPVPTVPAGLPSVPVGWISDFSVWSSFHPGEAPDMTGWSAGKIEAWKDHQTLWRNTTEGAK